MKRIFSCIIILFFVSLLWAAINLDGAGDYFDCGNDASLDLAGDEFTILVWADYQGPGEDGQGGTICGRYAGGKGFLMYIRTAGNDVFFWQDDSAQWVFITDLTPIIGQWCYVAFVRDGTNDTVYFNNVQIGQRAKGTMSAVTASFPIGRYLPSAAQGWNGKISELIVIQRALSLDEIKNTHHRRYIPDSDTKGYWRLDEGAINLAPGGDTAVDLSGNENHGSDAGNPVYIDEPPIQWNQGD